VHGSAPEIAGKSLANPTALLLAAGLTPDHIGCMDLARCLHGAVDAVLNEDKVRIGDLRSGASTQDFAHAVARRVEANA
jgi:isocitrate dehydrogenase (NAD+)